MKRKVIAKLVRKRKIESAYCWLKEVRSSNSSLLQNSHPVSEKMGEASSSGSAGNEVVFRSSDTTGNKVDFRSSDTTGRTWSPSPC